MSTAETAAAPEPNEQLEPDDYIRREVVRCRLAQIVAAQALQVVDIGGGAGDDAAWLVWLGHRVLVADPSKAQLEKAAERRKRLPEDIGMHLLCQPWTATDLANKGANGRYDLVLAHNVASYTDGAAEFIQTVLRLAKPGGYVSVLEPGPGNVAAHTPTSDISAAVPAQRTDADGIMTVSKFDGLVKDTRPNSQVETCGIRLPDQLNDWVGRPASYNVLTRIIQQQLRQGVTEATWDTADWLHFVVRVDCPRTTPL